MIRPFFLIFLIILIVEIVLFIQVGGRIGAGSTIIAIFATGIIGVILVRHQGIRTLATVQAKMAQGKMPGREIAEGFLLLLAGIFLLLPGFFTDTLGFLQIIPAVRHMVVDIILAMFGHRMHGWAAGKTQASHSDDAFTSQRGAAPGANPFQQSQSQAQKTKPRFHDDVGDPVVLEGEYRHEPDNDGSKDHDKK